MQKEGNEIKQKRLKKERKQQDQNVTNLTRTVNIRTAHMTVQNGPLGLKQIYLSFSVKKGPATFISFQCSHTKDVNNHILQ